MNPANPNRLYFGDCLEIMAEFMPDESVDLIYLDPPFNSKRILQRLHRRRPMGGL